MPKDKKNNKQEKFKTQEDAFAYLRSLATMSEPEINMSEAALALGYIFLPGISIDRYRFCVAKLEEEVKTTYIRKMQLDKQDSLYNRVTTLREVVYDNNEFKGDINNFENLDNINFIRVLETKKGIPVAMGILLMHLAEKIGWECSGVSFPGHFLLRMDYEGERAIIDPFARAKFMEAHDLRDLIKSILGNSMELSQSFYSSVSKRDVLLRMQNNMKARFIEEADYKRAILAIEGVEAFYPEEYRVHLDKGVLYAKLRNCTKSVESLKHYIEKTPNQSEKRQAEVLLQEIKATLG